MNLNFSEFPEIQEANWLIPAPCDNLKALPEIYARFCSAIYMTTHIGGASDKYMITDSEKSAAYLRAALHEFSSIEDIIKINFSDIDEKKYRICKSSNPLFHIMKLLRNYNVHVSMNKVAAKNMQVISLHDTDEIFDITVKYINNLSLSELEKTRDSQRYSKSDLKKMINYFNNQQHEFGVCELIKQGILLYSKQINYLLSNGEFDSNSRCL